jgi:hypothetical protein
MLILKVTPNWGNEVHISIIESLLLANKLGVIVELKFNDKTLHIKPNSVYNELLDEYNS